jgi:2'-5' RNA ligase
MRLFFAITLPNELKSRISAAQNDLRAAIGDDGVRWARPEQFHYTLRFVGETTPQRARRAICAASDVALRWSAFDLSIAGMGAFPSAARPGTLWLGAGAGAETFAAMAADLDERLGQEGFPRERRPVTAHLTLARVTSYAGERAVARTLKMSSLGEVGAVRVDLFVLMQSRPSSAGSDYCVIEEIKLPVREPSG